MAPTSGGYLVRMTGISKRYGAIQVLDNVDLTLPFLDKRAMLAAATAVLDSLGIVIPDVRLKVETLSGDQRQSIAIGRAASFNPAVLITDEPTAALAVAEVDAVLDLIRKVSALMRPLGQPIAGYLELHIEQGSILEQEATPIGVVTGIQGTRWFAAAFTGQTAHAGTTSGELRRDPLAAATKALSALYDSLMPAGSDVRFTVGRMRLPPGSTNAIPQSAEFSVDLRRQDPGRLDGYETRIRTVCETAAREARCAFAMRRTVDIPPATFAPSIIEAISNAADKCAIKWRRIPSCAFHDALYLSRMAPTGMIFIPCRDGLSHNEGEFVEPEQVRIGADVLLATTIELLTP